MYRRLSKNIRFAKNCPPQPMNKQKGDKKKKAFFTCMINLLVAEAIINVSCDCDPRELTFFTRNQHPLRTLSRRVDGAFPSVTNPKAIWEIKEYYYTTTFGRGFSVLRILRLSSTPEFLSREDPRNSPFGEFRGHADFQVRREKNLCPRFLNGEICHPFIIESENSRVLGSVLTKKPASHVCSQRKHGDFSRVIDPSL